MELNAATGNRTVNVSEQVFGRSFNEALVHQVVTSCLEKQRAGTKAQKSRAAVSGGGKKPWRQKGTGRARAGSIRSPLWTGGGVTFAASPRQYAPKVNRRMYRAALQTILSELARRERLVVINDPTPEERKTRSLLQAVRAEGVEPTGLLIVDELQDNLRYAANNVVDLDVVAALSVDPVILVAAEKVMVTEQALQSLEGWLS